LYNSGIAVEVTHQFMRQLFGVVGLAPLRDVVRAPDRPDLGMRPARHKHDADDAADSVVLLLPLIPLALFDRRQLEYTDLE
jgi:hypothetical protein